MFGSEKYKNIDFMESTQNQDLLEKHIFLNIFELKLD